MTCMSYLITLSCVVCCWGFPLHPAEEDKVQNVWETSYTNIIFELLPILGFFLCLVTIVAGCLCCQKGRFKGLENEQNGRIQDGYDNMASEFAIFPPAPYNRQSRGSLVDVKFEPLPDIRLRGHGSSSSQPRPANFSNVVNRGLSVEDWFDEPYSNFPRHQLKYLQEVGSGWFGQVVEGEGQGIAGIKKTKVVVKILREDATPTDQIYFLHEVKPFRDLNHPNVLKLLGKCVECDPFLLLFEHCAFKDLRTYLIQHRSESESLIQENLLLRMVCDIAAGLHHMHNHSFIHTDLAACNCLVGSDLRVKIGDYGNSIEKFRDNYYCAGDIAVPIRWCAPESLRCTDTTIETKEVTCEANIWSFGVVLWEVMEFGKLPYFDLHNEDVLQKVIIERSVQLPQPCSNCTHQERVYQVMKLCWLNDPSLRPNMEKLEALLAHLYKYKDLSTDFEQRWHLLQPNISRSTNIIATIETSAAMKFENNFGDHPSNARESEKWEKDRLHDLSPSPHSSLNLDFSTTNEHSMSPSLQNLRGSLDDMCHPCALSDHASVSESELNGSLLSVSSSMPMLANGKVKAVSLELLMPSSRQVQKEFDAWLLSQQAKGAEASQMAMEISEAMQHLDSALAQENGSVSSEGNSAKSTPERDVSQQNVSSKNEEAEANMPSLTDSLLSDDETWKDIIARSGPTSTPVTELVKEKSQSVQDFMKLTVIDSDNSSDSDSFPQEVPLSQKGVSMSDDAIFARHDHISFMLELERFAFMLVKVSMCEAMKQVMERQSLMHDDITVSTLGALISPHAKDGKVLNAQRSAEITNHQLHAFNREGQDSALTSPSSSCTNMVTPWNTIIETDESLLTFRCKLSSSNTQECVTQKHNEKTHFSPYKTNLEKVKRSLSENNLVPSFTLNPSIKQNFLSYPSLFVQNIECSTFCDISNPVKLYSDENWRQFSIDNNDNKSSNAENYDPTITSEYVRSGENSNGGDDNSKFNTSVCESDNQGIESGLIIQNENQTKTTTDQAHDVTLQLISSVSESCVRSHDDVNGDDNHEPLFDDDGNNCEIDGVKGPKLTMKSTESDYYSFPVNCDTVSQMENNAVQINNNCMMSGQEQPKTKDKYIPLSHSEKKDTSIHTSMNTICQPSEVNSISVDEYLCARDNDLKSEIFTVVYESESKNIKQEFNDGQCNENFYENRDLTDDGEQRINLSSETVVCVADNVIVVEDLKSVINSCASNEINEDESSTKSSNGESPSTSVDAVAACRTECNKSSMMSNDELVNSAENEKFISSVYFDGNETGTKNNESNANVYSNEHLNSSKYSSKFNTCVSVNVQQSESECIKDDSSSEQCNANDDSKNQSIEGGNDMYLEVSSTSKCRIHDTKFCAINDKEMIKGDDHDLTGNRLDDVQELPLKLSESENNFVITALGDSTLCQPEWKNGFVEGIQEPLFGRKSTILNEQALHSAVVDNELPFHENNFSSIACIDNTSQLSSLVSNGDHATKISLENNTQYDATQFEIGKAIFAQTDSISAEKTPELSECQTMELMSTCLNELGSQFALDSNPFASSNTNIANKVGNVFNYVTLANGRHLDSSSSFDDFDTSNSWYLNDNNSDFVGNFVADEIDTLLVCSKFVPPLSTVATCKSKQFLVTENLTRCSAHDKPLSNGHVEELDCQDSSSLSTKQKLDDPDTESHQLYVAGMNKLNELHSATYQMDFCNIDNGRFTDKEKGIITSNMTIAEPACEKTSSYFRDQLSKSSTVIESALVSDQKMPSFQSEKSDIYESMANDSYEHKSTPVLDEMFNIASEISAKENDILHDIGHEQQIHSRELELSSSDKVDDTVSDLQNGICNGTVPDWPHKDLMFTSDIDETINSKGCITRESVSVSSDSTSSVDSCLFELVDLQAALAELESDDDDETNEIFNHVTTSDMEKSNIATLIDKGYSEQSRKPMISSTDSFDDEDDDVLIVDTETNEALLLEGHCSRKNTGIEELSNTKFLSTVEFIDDCSDCESGKDDPSNFPPSHMLLTHDMENDNWDHQSVAACSLMKDSGKLNYSKEVSKSPKEKLLSTISNDDYMRFEMPWMTSVAEAKIDGSTSTIVHDLPRIPQIVIENVEDNFLQSKNDDSESALLSPEKCYAADWESESTSSGSHEASSTSGEFDCSKAHEDDVTKHNCCSADDDDNLVASFRISSWNKDATPTKSSFLSHNKKKQQLKKSVSFNTPDEMLVYQYPQEEVFVEVSPRRSWHADSYGSQVDMDNFADWEFNEAENIDMEEPDEDESRAVCCVKTGSFYNLGNYQDDTDIMDDGANEVILYNTDQGAFSFHELLQHYGGNPFYSSDENSLHDLYLSEFETTYEMNPNSAYNYQVLPYMSADDCIVNDANTDNGKLSPDRPVTPTFDASLSHNHYVNSDEASLNAADDDHDPSLTNDEEASHDVNNDVLQSSNFSQKSLNKWINLTDSVESSETAIDNQEPKLDWNTNTVTNLESLEPHLSQHNDYTNFTPQPSTTNEHTGVESQELLI